jgi:primase-polymerase (primpol)-like protein
LKPLIERPQWTVWRWTCVGDRWSKPPFMAMQPDRHASTGEPDTWTDYATALATVQAGHADGITYILTKDDPFAARSILITAAMPTLTASTSGHRTSLTAAAIPIPR